MSTNKTQAEQLPQDAVMQSVIFTNELRIGNLLYFGNTKCKVVEIQKECFYVETEKGIELKNTTSDFKPVKITENIISEICFNESKIMGLYRLDATSDFSIAFSLDNDMIYIGDDIEIRISKTPLHIFQNIYFFLTGNELTVA